MRKRLAAAALVVASLCGTAAAGEGEARGAIRKGNESFARAEYERAIAEYRRAFGAEGGLDATARYNVGVCLYELGRTREAVEEYRAAIRSRGGAYPKASYALGVALEDLGDWAGKDFTENLFTLLKETFEGPPPKTASAFLDQGCGLFQTVEGLTAEEASRPARPGGTTVAAHCAHMRFYLDVLHRYMRGPIEPADWKQSWLVQTVTPEEWELLRRELRAGYDTISEALRSVEGWGERPIGVGMAVVAHTAYHLGAVRQLLRMLEQGHG